MGNCVPVQKNKDPSLKVRVLVDSKTECVLVQSTIKEHKLGCEESGVEDDAPSFRGLNGKEEIFFDSNPWLDSDCEDFYSVNGDNTPSSGSSPIHHSSSINSPQPGKPLGTDREAISISQCSPGDTKRPKLLIELFRESINDEISKSDQYLQKEPGIKPIILLSPPNTTAKRSPFSADSNGKIKSARSTQCCIPRSFSLNEKKKRLSFTQPGAY